ncbi:MAG TPA: hydroxyisourate hydrolase [Magnetospirillaceae bacterium]|nr:hydroxyisourate hydrolase [Magnetospirillaceae bacterium]
MTLSTHVLDTSRGCPAEGVSFHLTRDGQELFAGFTNEDGRCPGLRDLKLPVGRYRLEFRVVDYFRKIGVELTDPPFLEVIPIDFGIGDPETHYHVPLLLSPYGYSTYRGS